MANYFSLENTDELLERLHNRARSCVTDKALIYYDAIDVIEQLLSENAKLKAERDAAIADIPTACGYCKWFEQKWLSNGDFIGDCHCPRPCDNVSGANTQWEWRGVQDD